MNAKSPATEVGGDGPKHQDPPATPTKQEDGRIEPTEAESKFLRACFRNMRCKPDVDWDKVAAELGFKDASSASRRGRTIFAKHGLGGQTPSKGQATPQKGSKGGDAADGGPVPDSATKVSKSRTPRKKKVKEEI